ncbi:MAG: hypothetical protein A2W99_14975 [Bacteroidetes bacterium GWF2_33_16]|nr:MAG: hypothetical protein A2X00_00110 [Bacteroidetes bacterium GWE2_32_14]OFY07630.1 MAG: hypothetical protein A2W99_14975 [Bacteroidetes bacterium GWF2_33_16]
MNFNKWYKNKIESLDQDPPEIVWENIQDDLDIDHSWVFVKDYLDKNSRNRRQFIYAVAASLILFITAGTYWLFILQRGQGELQLISTQQTFLETQNKNKKEDQAFVELKNEFINQKDERKPIDKKRRIKPEPHELFSQQQEELRTNESFLASFAASNFSSENNITTNYMNLREIDSESDNLTEKTERKAFKEVYIGTIGQFANTWMLNDKTLNGLDSDNLTKTNASFGYNLGFFIGTNISQKTDMQLDLDFLVNNNQNYNEYLNGHYVSSQMRLNYSQASLSLRYLIISKRFIKGEHRLSIGSYLGYLRNAYQVIEGESVSVLNTYNNFDYGLLLGYEYVIPVYNKIDIGTGFRAYYGLQNIYSGDNTIPSYMNKTNNASVNITLSIKYDWR